MSSTKGSEKGAMASEVHIVLTALLFSGYPFNLAVGSYPQDIERRTNCIEIGSGEYNEQPSKFKWREVSQVRRRYLEKECLNRLGLTDVGSGFFGAIGIGAITSVRVDANCFDCISTKRTLKQTWPSIHDAEDDEREGVLTKILFHEMLWLHQFQVFQGCLKSYPNTIFCHCEPVGESSARCSFEDSGQNGVSIVASRLDSDEIGTNEEQSTINLNDLANQPWTHRAIEVHHPAIRSTNNFLWINDNNRTRARLSCLCNGTRREKNDVKEYVPRWVRSIPTGSGFYSLEHASLVSLMDIDASIDGKTWVHLLGEHCVSDLRKIRMWVPNVGDLQRGK